MLLGCCADCCLSHSFDWTCPRHELMFGKNIQAPLILQILIKVVPAIHSGVFSCLLAWVVTIIRGGLGDASGCTIGAQRGERLIEWVWELLYVLRPVFWLQTQEFSRIETPTRGTSIGGKNGHQSAAGERAGFRGSEGRESCRWGSST